MSESGWWERHGAVFTSIITLISVLTYLHVSLNDIRDELRSEAGSLRNEMSSFRTEIKAEIKDLRASLDRVETKVDEVRGYLRFNASATQYNPPPKE